MASSASDRRPEPRDSPLSALQRAVRFRQWNLRAYARRRASSQSAEYHSQPSAGSLSYIEPMLGVISTSNAFQLPLVTALTIFVTLSCHQFGVAGLTSFMLYSLLVVLPVADLLWNANKGTRERRIYILYDD